MSEELRPCPFCGSTNICTEKGINLNYCDSCSAEANIEHWNIRPIEDDLRKRIARLEEKLAELVEVGNKMRDLIEQDYDGYLDETIDWRGMAEEADDVLQEREE